MKKNIIMIILLSMFSCNLQDNTGLKSVVDDNKLAETLCSGQWFGLSYGVMGGFVLSMEFNSDKTTMDFTVASFGGDKKVETREIKISNNILYRQNDITDSWEIFFRIVSYSEKYLSVYFYVDGEEVSMISKFMNANDIPVNDNETESNLINYSELISSKLYMSEAIDIFTISSFISGVNSDIDKELSDTINEQFNNSGSGDIDEILNELTTNPDHSIFNKLYTISLLFDFNSNIVVIKGYKNELLDFEISSKFIIENNILKIQGINDKWEVIGKFNSVTNSNVSIGLISEKSDIIISNVNFSLDNDL